MTRAKDISKIVTDADLSGTLDVAGELQVGVDGTTAGLIRLMDSGSVTEEATISTDANGGLIFGGNSGPGELIFRTGSSTKRMDISSGGDISFYEDTGTTPKLFWDASAESLGIGTTTPSQKVEASGASNTVINSKTTLSTALGGFTAYGNSTSHIKMFQFGSSYGGTAFAGLTGNNQAIIEAQEASSLVISTQGGTPDIVFAPARTARMTITNGGNVGIGTSSPTSYANSQATLFIEDSINPAIALSDTGQSKDYFISALGTQLSIRYADGGGSSNATNITELIKMDNSGAVTMPNQPAFQVNPSSNQLNMANGDTLIFAQEKFDQNSDFSSNTFTAPVTGKYQLQLTARIDVLDRNANWVRVEMVTSNRTYEANIIDPDAFDKNPDHWSFNFSVLADMDANDTVFLRWGQSGGSNTADLDTQAHFSGYLVC